MKTITVRLPESLAAQLEAESRRRSMSKSDIVRERISSGAQAQTMPDAIADLAGSLDGLPADLSAGKKRYLRTLRYGRKRPG